MQVREILTESKKLKGIKQGPPYKHRNLVSIIQKQLRKLGYDIGRSGVDGLYGPDTAGAIADFKNDLNINTPGNILLVPEIYTLIQFQDRTVLPRSRPDDLKIPKIPMPVPRPDEPAGSLSDIGIDVDDLDSVPYPVMRPDDLDLPDIDATEKGSGTGKIKYRLGGVRNRKPDGALIDIIKDAAEIAGVDVIVFSGGQMPYAEWKRNPNRRKRGNNYYIGNKQVRKGSTRHDMGLAADIRLVADGEALPTDRQHPLVYKFVAAAVDLGATGIGLGPGYMSNTGIHVDIARGGYWGSGGKGANAPDYLVGAYRDGKAGVV